ncbi:MAG TPA: HPr family phosphocarrier protein [Clostridiales bacterium]|nr:HPr family phosphocarrier protein [Clostridiales bacterium]
MKSFTYTLTDPEGFHARPAGLFVKKVKEFPCAITVEKDGKKADARKMFGLMGLGIKGGETITVTVDGDQEAEAAAALEAFLKENL